MERRAAATACDLAIHRLRFGFDADNFVLALLFEHSRNDTSDFAMRHSPGALDEPQGSGFAA